MAFTMHSHSGQFCPGHAVSTLESVIQRALSLGFRTIGLTEHMPRLAPCDLYPEEIEEFTALYPDEPALAAEKAIAVLRPRHEAYLLEARRLREVYEGRIEVLVGFEGEFIRGEYEGLVKELGREVDYFIGSLHHSGPLRYTPPSDGNGNGNGHTNGTNGTAKVSKPPAETGNANGNGDGSGIPIDFDAAHYLHAVSRAGSERALFANYYDLQHDMLLALQPRVVGHFDLIRLLSSFSPRSPHDNNMKDAWPDVWAKIVRNLEVVRGYGGWIECNTSGLRKGLEEPYPAGEVAKVWTSMGGRWTVGDDSHGVGQVATNYGRGLGYLRSLGVEEVWTLTRVEGEVREKRVGLEEFEGSLRLDG